MLSAAVLMYPAVLFFYALIWFLSLLSLIVRFFGVLPSNKFPLFLKDGSFFGVSFFFEGI